MSTADVLESQFVSFSIMLTVRDLPLAPPADRAKPPVILVFHVKDVRATYDALSGLGLRLLTPPQQPPWGGWRCFAQDPDGYLIEIEQP